MAGTKSPEFTRPLLQIPQLRIPKDVGTSKLASDAAKYVIGHGDRITALLRLHRRCQLETVMELRTKTVSS
jgi:hypothetical protein